MLQYLVIALLEAPVPLGSVYGMSEWSSTGVRVKQIVFQSSIEIWGLDCPLNYSQTGVGLMLLAMCPKWAQSPGSSEVEACWYGQKRDEGHARNSLLTGPGDPESNAHGYVEFDVIRLHGLGYPGAQLGLPFFIATSSWRNMTASALRSYTGLSLVSASMLSCLGSLTTLGFLPFMFLSTEGDSH